jgi:hypothetical protein
MSPKITVHGGATNAREADVSPVAAASQSPQVGAEADLGRTNEADAGEAPAEEPQEDAPVAQESAPDPYASMTLAELRAEADKRQVPSYGTKAQVTERLRESDGAAEGDADEE